MTQINYKKLTKELLDVYEKYLKNPVDVKNREEAQGLYHAYWQASPLFDEVLSEAIGYLIHMGLDLASTPSQDVIEGVIKKLKEKLESSNGSKEDKGENK